MFSPIEQMKWTNLHAGLEPTSPFLQKDFKTLLHVSFVVLVAHSRIELLFRE